MTEREQSPPSTDNFDIQLGRKILKLGLEIIAAEEKAARLAEIAAKRTSETVEWTKKCKKIEKLLIAMENTSKKMKRMNNLLVDGQYEIQTSNAEMNAKIVQIERQSHLKVPNDADRLEIQKLEDELAKLKMESEGDNDAGFTDEKTAQEAIQAKQKVVASLKMELAKSLKPRVTTNNNSKENKYDFLAHYREDVCDENPQMVRSPQNGTPSSNYELNDAKE